MSSGKTILQVCGEPRWRYTAATAAGILFLIYVAQIFSPLRMNPDSAELLDLASRITDHRSLLLDGVKSRFPLGAPLLFSAMERIGIANSKGFVSVNVLFLLIAAAASVSIFRSIGIPFRRRVLAILAAFCSFTLMKHAEMPLSDIPFMAASLGAIAFLESAARSDRREKILRFVMASLLVIVAILFRRIGVALIPACLYVWWPSRGGVSSFSEHRLSPSFQGCCSSVRPWFTYRI